MKYELLVNEPTGKGTWRCTCIDECDGDGQPCIRTAYEQMRSGFYDRNAQFIVQENGLIIAISIKGAMLWLDNVPDPPYFEAPKSRVKLSTGEIHRA